MKNKIKKFIYNIICKPVCFVYDLFYAPIKLAEIKEVVDNMQPVGKIGRVQSICYRKPKFLVDLFE